MHTQGVEDNASRQEHSPSAAAEVPASQDDGWGEQTGWDFQDVPLDSPKSTSKQPSTSQAGSPVRRAAQAARQGQVSPRQGDGHDMQLASLQKANDALTARLKHVETVRQPNLEWLRLASDIVHVMHVLRLCERVVQPVIT